MKSKTIIYYYIILLIFSPFVGYFAITFLHNGPNNVFSALTLFIFILFVLESMAIRKRIVIPKYLWYYIAFILYTIISDYIIVGKTINIKYLYSNYMITAVLVLILIENATFSKRNIKYLNFFITFIVLTAFIVILIQQFYNYKFFVDLSKQNVFDFLNTVEFLQRLPSIYSWIGSLEVGFTFLPMLAILIENSLKRRHKIRVWSWFLIGIIFSFLTKFRWIMLNYLVLFSLPYIYYKQNLTKLITNLIIGFFIIIFGLSIADYFGAPVYSIIENRILEKSNGGLEQGSASTRLLAVYIFAELYPNHPIIGKGDFHTFDVSTDKDFELSTALGGRSSQIHVGYLSLLYYYGIVGAVLFLLFLYFLMKRLYRHAKLSGYWAPFFGVLGFVIANFTLVDFNFFHAGLMIAILYDRYLIQQKSIEAGKENNEIKMRFLQ